jgi:hypothetical protein
MRRNQHQTPRAGNLQRRRHRPVNAQIDTAQGLSDPRGELSTPSRKPVMEVVVLPPLVALIAGILILFGHYSA